MRWRSEALDCLGNSSSTLAASLIYINLLEEVMEGMCKGSHD
jgi:hypothetical protein